MTAAILVMLALSAPDFSDARHRSFVGVDENVRVDVLELEDGRALIHVDGVKVGATAIAQMKRVEKIYRAPDGLVGFQLRQLRRKILYAGSARTQWALVHLGDDIALVESEGPRPDLEKLYAEFNGTSSGSAASSSAPAESFARLCTKVPKPTGSKPISGALWLSMSDLCADADYRAALQGYKTITVRSADKPGIKKAGKTLTISVPKDIPNLRLALRKVLEDEL
ncbi:MAG: hypothetical protein AAFQ82_07320 [Myxococcota bacterium]